MLRIEVHFLHGLVESLDEKSTNDLSLRLRVRDALEFGVKGLRGIDREQLTLADERA